MGGTRAFLDPNIGSRYTCGRETYMAAEMIERRIRRSDNQSAALRFQLENTRKRGRALALRPSAGS